MSGEDRLKDHPEWVIDRQGTTMVLYKGLLHMAHVDGLKSIRTAIVQCPSELNGSTAIVHAEVETSKGVFEGIGDASPTNVNRMIVAHLIRMAETRAKARALRDALDIGFVAAEELGGDEDASQTHGNASARPAAANGATRTAPTAWPATGNVVRSGASHGAPDLAKLRETYRVRTGEAIALGIVPTPLPDDATANTILDLGVQLKDALDAKRAELDAQRRGQPR